MGRPGIEPGKIRDVISKLDAEGKAVSVTSIRERLGSGSYSTFQRRARRVAKRAGQGRPAHGACDARGGLSPR